MVSQSEEDSSDVSGESSDMTPEEIKARIAQIIAEKKKLVAKRVSPQNSSTTGVSDSPPPLLDSSMEQPPEKKLPKPKPANRRKNKSKRH